MATIVEQEVPASNICTYILSFYLPNSVTRYFIIPFLNEDPGAQRLKQSHVV